MTISTLFDRLMRRLTGESQASRPSPPPAETATPPREQSASPAENTLAKTPSETGTTIADTEHDSLGSGAEIVSEEQRGLEPDLPETAGESDGDTIAGAAASGAEEMAGETSEEDSGEEAPHGPSDGWRLELPDEPLSFAVIPEELPGDIVPLEEVRRAAIVEPPPAAEEERAAAAEGETTAVQEPQSAGSSLQQALGFTLCLRCFGGGEITTPAPCPACLGAREDWCEGISITCRVCHGTGRVNIPCPECEGQGWRRPEPEQPADSVAEGTETDAAAAELKTAEADIEGDSEAFLGSSELSNGHIQRSSGADDVTA